ncbi:efflux RND transporter periplasmic adaptor subunit [Fulvivirga sp. M361]|uniref:efflux RND transporter periplasmic adaptor subunit n=1 Tax=Fulvivirga sp. M361 TaxID=2594266 RepID=UPI002105C5C6|nr:HlyD family efflux transporter periplasmic adaptor subunit [Fulvivirga sp. M361]
MVAPYNGLVTEALADKGSLVSPGQMVGTIINNQHFELEAAASIEVVSKLKVGDQIKFQSNEIEGDWIGTVIRINEIVDTKTQNIPIYFDIKGPNLKAGMYLEGVFMGISYGNVFTIPSSILTRDDKVLLLKDGVIIGKPVELVEFMQDSILVRGLSNQDLLIANQFSVPVEGLKLSM